MRASLKFFLELILLVGFLCRTETVAAQPAQSPTDYPAWMDAKLRDEIKAWKKGDPVPARLIKFHEGKEPEESGHIGVIGSRVGHYIVQLHDADLLAAILFDHRAEIESFRAAVHRLIELKGINQLAKLVEDKAVAEPKLMKSPELTTLSAHLRNPLLRIRVANIRPGSMSKEEAEKALQKFADDLSSGMSWKEAYAKHAELNPDLAARAKNPKVKITHLGYRFSGTVTMDGFDVSLYRKAGNFPLEHLPKLPEKQDPVQIYSGNDSPYLYFIEERYAPKK